MILPEDNCYYSSEIFDDRIGRSQGGYKMMRRQAGGNRKLVFYTCFFGPDGSVANKIPEPPSTKYPCLFFSNNRETIERAKAAKWTTVYVDKDIKSTNKDNAMDSKELKACPHHFPELEGYEYSCYFDTKLHVKDADVEEMIGKYLDGKEARMLVNKHRAIGSHIWDEFKEAMKQKRYSANRNTYSSYIKEQVSSGLKNTVNHHYETGFIVRKSGEETNRIGDKWYEHIKRAGIECQISFFFIQQLFKDKIVCLPTIYGNK